MRIIKLLLFINLIFISSLGISQEVSQNPFSGVEIGSKKFYSIKMNNGIGHQSRIVSVDSKETLLMNSDGSTFLVPTDEIIQIKEKEFSSLGSIGAGFGIPYGIFGLNLDLRLFKYLYFTGGLGTAIFVTPMYNIGGKLFLRSGNHKWRPRLSAYYGTNGFLYVEDGDIRESFTGASLALGQQWTLGITKAVGIDFDVVYIVDDSKIEQRFQELKSQGYQFEIEALGNVKISLGIRYCF